jgi:predicted DNA-binding transcriptional regulator AlpA
MAEDCMRTPGAAAYVALAASTLTKMRLTGDGPLFVKVGPRAVAYRKADLDAWLAARVRRSTSDGWRANASATPERPQSAPAESDRVLAPCR